MAFNLKNRSFLKEIDFTRKSCAQIILIWRMLGWQLGVPAGFRDSPRIPAATAKA